ncbi:alpha/beta hydrolase [Marivirga salinae]|uniref:Alpha/beta hydrolase n=1 Tax=Marivirga salinarum TaxID=3059078 RepID=A0AA51NA85_9BACT|nr:alpha/beta hydrolase [Marivirga sp. BDSF4-3]WMN11662.1 alpha/beta hydrolase [Marivirga sp. BDSF4-3]
MKQLVYQSIGFYLDTLSNFSPKKTGKLGFKLMCRPQNTGLRAHQKEFLSTSTQSDYNFNGNRIRIYQWGSGPKKILFVHGWQSHSFRWKKYIESLPKDEFTLIAYDAPGHGQSGGNQFTVPLNAFLIDELVSHFNGFDTIVAHSIGSMSVFYALAYYQIKDVKRVVSLAAPNKAEEFFNFFGNILKLKSQTMNQIANEFQMQVRHKIDDISLPQFASKVDVPGIIIHDENDKETPFENALKLKAKWKNSKLIKNGRLGS